MTVDDAWSLYLPLVSGEVEGPEGVEGISTDEGENLPDLPDLPETRSPESATREVIL